LHKNPPPKKKQHKTKKRREAEEIREEGEERHPKKTKQNQISMFFFSKLTQTPMRAELGFIQNENPKTSFLQLVHWWVLGDTGL
jgi:hypothetical protein